MAKRYDPIMCMMVDEPTKAQDGILFYQLRFSSGRTEGAKLDESEIRSYAEALLEKYGEKQVAVSRQGKIVATYLNRKAYDSASALDNAIKTCDAASGDAMKQIANTAKACARQYNQLFEKATTAEEVKKLKSQKDNDYHRAMDNLDKIYNEVSQVYGRARSEVRDLFDEVDSNGFKAYQRVTQK